MDMIAELGELAFATRLKRLSERLMKDVSVLYKKLGVDFEPRWFAVLYTLHKLGPMAVTELAGSLRLTHTAVNHLATEMAKTGLLKSARGTRDERQRFLILSSKGEQVLQKLTPVWEQIRLATNEMLAGTDCDLLAAFSSIEQQLDDQDMVERVWIRLKGQPPSEVEIVEYSPAFKKHFKALNYEWLEKYFQIEKEDEKILANPNAKIIKTGGAIFFACLDDKVVGTCALIKHRNDIYEIAKMAVTAKFQGRGIGRKLLQAVLTRAKKLGLTEIFLLTNERLESANHLYKKTGFQITDQNPFSAARYERSTYVMRLNLEQYETIPIHKK